jgi:hypothetical protein
MHDAWGSFMAFYGGDVWVLDAWDLIFWLDKGYE